MSTTGDNLDYRKLSQGVVCTTLLLTIALSIQHLRQLYIGLFKTKKFDWNSSFVFSLILIFWAYAIHIAWLWLLFFTINKIECHAIVSWSTGSYVMIKWSLYMFLTIRLEQAFTGTKYQYNKYFLIIWRLFLSISSVSQISTIIFLASSRVDYDEYDVGCNTSYHGITFVLIGLTDIIACFTNLYLFARQLWKISMLVKFKDEKNNSNNSNNNGGSGHKLTVDSNTMASGGNNSGKSGQITSMNTLSVDTIHNNGDKMDVRSQSPSVPSSPSADAVDANEVNNGDNNGDNGGQMSLAAPMTLDLTMKFGGASVSKSMESMNSVDGVNGVDVNRMNSVNSVNSDEIEIVDNNNNNNNGKNRNKNSSGKKEKKKVLENAISKLTVLKDDNDRFIKLIRKYTILTALGVGTTLITVALIATLGMPTVWGALDSIFNLLSVLLMFTWNKEYYYIICNCCERCIKRSLSNNGSNERSQERENTRTTTVDPSI